jgi:hypothetical protein
MASSLLAKANSFLLARISGIMEVRMATLPDDFFTVATFGTLLGSVTLTTVTTGALYKQFGLSPAKTGLIVSCVVVAAALFLADKIGDPKSDIIGFFNACLVYLSASGVSDAAAGKFRDGGGRPFFRSWFH